MNWKKEFSEFNSTNEIRPSPALTQRVCAQVLAELHPNPFRIFAKLGLTHFFSALFTLSICPQFGLRLWGSGPGLMGVFMRLGTYGCPLACGFIFTGTTLLAARFVLKAHEVQFLRKKPWLQLASLTLLSLGFFVMFSSEIIAGFAAVWALGSLIGGWATLSLGSRRHFVDLHSAP